MGTYSRGLLRGWGRVVVAVVCLIGATGVSAADPPGRREPSASAEHPLVPALKLARSSQEALREVRDYEALFTKRELVNGQLKTQSMLLKLRREPFSVYLLFREPNAGREVLYVDGKNGNKLLAHEGSGVKSLIGTVSLDPASPEAMDGSRHPITRIGLANLLDAVIGQWESELKYGETAVQYYPNAKLGDVQCKVVESKHPVPRKEFKFHMTRLFIDRTTNLPVRVEQYGWPTKGQTKPPLVEEYTYSNLRTNVGLTDADFDPKNKSYSF